MTDQPFTGDYTVLLFFAALGAIQIAAALNGLKGLLFLHHRLASLSLGAVLIAGAAAWFFVSEPRNVPDYTRGLNATQQFAGFCMGAGGASTLTALVAAMLHPSLGAGTPALPPGLDGLRDSHYPRLLWRALQRLLRRRP
ncbi:MAG: hypothetical protein EXR54_08985 [Dehalococcoidia bacterium]|nr:hypothetical protein [Dehalococcoidia bacterium]MSQ17675.1 hypothetical protein [Dehalococcoidia bacterium]